ncbi:MULTISPECIES: NADP-dependent oxidoreductase [Maricaulis]|jgi:NADPH-dependent curcumin reductase CurA|uniref:Alcohol dehydrogenase, zinc-binding domain protein n=1 Tax=Maricaulis maris (strain MCS10) TaxID=394221 RepID=Q0AR15_MARMM|nr:MULTISPECIES: NADP-dependent oxidoreductase [Maricaulis]ABI65272.1 Alcohol dehydrogenase, zinc-binding domain protein [Maricaulis maris MCS10]MAC88323.1 NADP-dependent oxidoreductase [Maricaulis sp.]
MKSREIHLNAYLKGAPDPKYYDVVETDVPAPGAGEVLVRNLYISVDPYMRGRMSGVHTYIAPFGIGQVMDGGAVGEVIESNFDGLKPGDHVSSMHGWREAYTAPGAGLTKIDTSILPPQAFLGIAGMPGLTAYVGLKRMIDLQPGETLWMSAGAGAVGSSGIQFAKAMGATVIATAGGAEKCAFVKSLGADHVVDYKATDDLTAAITAVAPDGVDGYFENVGGTHFTAALNTLRRKGRIAACGMIQRYNDTSAATLPDNLTMMIGKSLTIRGFIVSDHADMFTDFVSDLGNWMAAGKIKPAETVMDGIENAPAAFSGLFTGQNTGKMLVKI